MLLDVSHKLQQIRIQTHFRLKICWRHLWSMSNQTLPTPIQGNIGEVSVCLPFAKLEKHIFSTIMSKSINININNNNPKPVSPMSCWFHSCFFLFFLFQPGSMNLPSKALIKVGTSLFRTTSPKQTCKYLATDLQVTNGSTGYRGPKNGCSSIVSIPERKNDTWAQF